MLGEGFWAGRLNYWKSSSCGMGEDYRGTGGFAGGPLATVGYRHPRPMGPMGVASAAYAHRASPSPGVLSTGPSG